MDQQLLEGDGIMTTDTKPFLGRCKSCDYAVFATEEDLQPAQTFRDVVTGGAYRLDGGAPLARCPENHRVFRLKRIKGTYSEKFKCDSRCLNAKGHDCTCSCGGVNHGRGHAVTPVAVGDIKVARDNAPIPPAVQVVVDERSKVVHSETDRIKENAIFRPTQHIGTVGETIIFTGILRDKRTINDSILHVFYAEVRSMNIPFGCTVGELIGTAKVEWWMPKYVPDPGFKIGEVYDLKATVKRHDDHPRWGKTTVVTYLAQSVQS